ncbi:PrsW family glutamic-type intramembrane protease [Lactobacillaceae bacterium Scapto_B20]
MNNKSESKYIFCPMCGARNDSGANFCVQCGHALNNRSKNNQSNDNPHVENKVDAKNVFNTIIDSTTAELNKWTGGSGSVKISFVHFFAQVFKKHHQQDAEAIFAVGTDKTTPSLNEISNADVQPWLFSRILFTTVLAGLLLAILNRMNRGQDIMAAAVVLVISVPISALVLFFETNVFKNISFYKVIQMFLIGGILSLITTIFINGIVDQVVANFNSNFVESLSTGIIEEGAKVLIASYFVNKLNTKSILNGLLIGAAVGTGFAAFENIQYLYTESMSIHYALIRTASSISDHTEWCAIATAGLVLAKGSHKFKFNDFLSSKFLRFFILVALIHTCWDWGIPYLNTITVIPYIELNLNELFLAVVTWITVLILIHAGLREVKMLKIGIDNNIDSIPDSMSR